MYENAAHELDTIMAITLGRSSSSVGAGESFQTHIEALRTINKLSEEADELSDSADFFDSLVTWRCLGEDVDESDSQIVALREEANRARQRVDELVNITLKKCSTV